MGERERPELETTLDRLKAVPFLSACTPEELTRIAMVARVIEVAPGRVLTQEGEPGSDFFVIATGTATVTREGRKLATLGPGAYFGEIALLTEGLRTATVTADTSMRLLALGQKSFDTLLKESPGMAQKVLAGLAERVRGARGIPIPPQ